LSTLSVDAVAFVALARAYHSLGFNVLPIGADKRLVDVMEWKRWETERQTTSDLERLPFDRAVGVGAVCGAVSAGEGMHLVCIDADKAPGRAPLESILGNLGLPRDYAWAVYTPGKGGGWHVWITVAGLVEELAKKGLDAGRLEAPFPGTDHIELRWDAAYTVLPGSAHPEGGTYRWEHGNGTPPPTLPEAVDARRVARLGKWVGETTDGHRALASPLPEKIIKGAGQHPLMTSFAGTMRRRGASTEAILAALRVENDRICSPPLPDTDLVHIANSIGKKTPKDPLREDLRPLEQEAAHAAILRSKWLGRVRYAEHMKQWRRWTGKVWEAAPDAVVADAACTVLRREYAQQLAAASEDEGKRLLPLYKDACKSRSVLGGLFFLRGQDGVHTRAEEWDPEPYTLNCADGLLDMRTRVLRPHDPAAMCTRVTTWALGADGATSTGAWQRHLEKCLPSVDVRRQVQRDLGRSLVDAVLEHSLSIWYGIGRNGKSTTAEALLKGLAGYGMEAAKDLLVQTSNERHTTEIAELAGARLVFVEETTDGKHLDESQVKRLTGGGNKRAHFMRQDNFDVPQTFSLTLLVNHKPKVSGGDPGIWERLRLVPWTVRIPYAEQRPQEEVIAELEADGPWMLRWMVAGFADWQVDHHWIAEEVKAATHDYRAEEDELQRFVDTYCTEDTRAAIPMRELYEAYVRFYQREHPGWKEPTQKSLGALLRDRGVTPARQGHDNVRVYRGITLRATPEPAQVEWDEA